MKISTEYRRTQLVIRQGQYNFNPVEPKLEVSLRVELCAESVPKKVSQPVIQRCMPPVFAFEQSAPPLRVIA